MSDVTRPLFPDADAERDHNDADGNGELPPLNVRVSVDDLVVRVLGHVSDRALLVHETPPFGIYLVPDASGAPGLVTRAAWRDLVDAGRASILPDAHSHLSDTEMTRELCRRLDEAGVPNGFKAISIWLHAHWTADLRARFGEPTNAHVLRRWRSKCRTTRPG